MFIKAIVVPILVICLILFIGVSFNNVSGNEYERNLNETKNSNNIENSNDYMNKTGIATTPIIPNITLDNLNDSYTTSMTENQLKNELERINGLGTVYVRIIGNTVYIIKNGEDINNKSVSMGDTTIKDEIIRTVKNIAVSINKVCILDDADIYGNYNDNSSLDLSIYENRNNVIEMN